MSENSKPTDTSRREFVTKASAATGAAAIAPGIFLTAPANARPAEQPASDKNRWGILVDTNKCADNCNTCVTACQQENGWGHSEPNSNLEQKAQWIRSVSIKNKATGFAKTLPLMCQHCEHPPCVDVCPTGASFRRDDGIVLVDKHICIGCRYCMMACPYKARSFIHEDLHDQKPWAPRGKGTVESCTLCVHRVDEGKVPACVEACSADKHNALIFGDLYDKDSEISQELNKLDSVEIRSDLGLNTGIRYRGI
ncbi:Sulfite reduction-associated complex DsrMKJOP iron-sulfur protein DsrO (=HmeA) [hydrothermal vent metagenome]|uniref:Sulfite reduction-associated complex DsrMKJOP iron-sulfur protein DsrO (=HmeA) n=1 Tax=hydrothermal vent metagenome TaxID=652676 RepID=A0A3B0YP92_9ZZZZ